MPHDVLIAPKRVNVEGHIDVDRDDGRRFERAKKSWAEKWSHERQFFHFFDPLSLIPSCVSFNEAIKR